MILGAESIRGGGQLDMELLRLERFQKAIKLRALVVFVAVHAGLGLALFGLGRQVALGGLNADSVMMLTGTLLLYLGIVLAAFFIIWPLLPWIGRVRAARNFGERLLEDLPAVIQQIPAILEAIHEVVAAFREIKAEFKAKSSHPPKSSQEN
jgi:Flp pilus assembly protein TadB